MLQRDFTQLFGWHIDELHISETGLFGELSENGLDLFTLLSPDGGEQGNGKLINADQ